MVPKLIMARPVIKRLHEVSAKQTGELFGIIIDGAVLIVGLSFGLDTTIDPPEIVRETCQNNYPAGIDWCGLFQIAISPINYPDRTIHDKLKDVAVTSNPIYISKIVAESPIKSYMLINDRFSEVQFTIMEEEEINNQFFYIRINGKVTIDIEQPTRSCMLQSLSVLKTRFSSNNGLMFHFVRTDTYLHPTTIEAIPADMTLMDLYSSDQKLIEVQNAHIKGPAEVNVCLPNTSDGTTTGEPVSLTHSVSLRCNVTLPIDILCVVSKNRPVQESYGVLLDAVFRWLDLVYLYFKNFNLGDGQLAQYRTCHYFPKPLGHYLTFVFVNNSTNESLAVKRKSLHMQYDLPPTRPFFRIENVIQFGHKDVLLNVHVGLKHDRVPNGRISLVRGDYGYYHYLQKAYSDKGWGCAYRSFQTIFSWFRLQGYTMEDVPYHQEIQRCLVKIGDKPPSFLGTKSWIGSTEISFCLDEMLGVNSVILNVSSSDELNTLGSRLEYHFIHAGTPVMIGGGSLAHTILGIDFNDDTGFIKFLILDPHYVSPTNEDVLKHIQTKGGVFWRGPEFWDSGTFYNLCLPQPPSFY